MVEYVGWVRRSSIIPMNRDNIVGFQTTTKCLGSLRMINYNEEYDFHIYDYVNDGDTHSYTYNEKRFVVKTKNDKIQKYTIYYANKKNKISHEYICKNGEVILVKKYNDKGDLIGSIKKVDKIS